MAKNTKKKTTKKKQTSNPAAARSPAKTTYEQFGSALASTASFAAEVARETGGLIRDLASTMAKSPETDPAPRATDLLVHQHRSVEKLFEQIESSKKGLDATLRILADDLSAHIAIEEELFYPAIRKLNPDLILEGLEEHAMGRFALQRVLGTKSSDQSLKARLKALKELMTNHHHEEEHDLFPAVRKNMSNEALQKLGKAMKSLFEADVKRGHEEVLATFHDDLRKPVHAKSPKLPKPTSRTKNARRAHRA